MAVSDHQRKKTCLITVSVGKVTDTCDLRNNLKKLCWQNRNYGKLKTALENGKITAHRKENN